MAQRFGLIAAGGELATAAGVLPWLAGDATSAAARCFSDWLEGRGGIEPVEVREGIAQVRAFLLSHGMSRFQAAWEPDGQHHIRDLAGFRKREDDRWDYYVTSAAWSSEVCIGFDAKALATILQARGYLIGGNARHRASSVSVTGHGKLRLYHLSGRILEADGDE